MEKSDSYLHKKFKKQINVESIIQNDKENKKSAPVETFAQKTDQKEKIEKEKMDKTDNIEPVPNQSTNSSPSRTSNAKSSISVGNQQSSNSYISYVVSKQPDHHRPTSFDTKQTNYTDNTSSTSSILNNVYPTTNYIYSGDNYGSFNANFHRDDVKPEETSTPKYDEQKNSVGKYVCPYCNLVCSKPSVLQKHIRAHTNERPYPCESCGFSFKTRSNLYKHCRSRTHANRLLVTKPPDANNESEIAKNPPNDSEFKDEPKKPYKPRFHTAKLFDNPPQDSTEDAPNTSTTRFVSHQINKIINRNNSSAPQPSETFVQKEIRHDEPLNLTKNRKRSMSEVTEPVIQKSLIKELLLKNLSSSDMQCPHCKMIFQTVTELDVHKYRNCKGKSAGPKYTRSSSVNVASILTHNKNAFDNIPRMQFPLDSPGPFLGKTRLIESDKTKSFSFDSGNLPLVNRGETASSPPNYLSSPLSFDKDKKPRIKLFGGEVKVHSSGESKTFKIEDEFDKDANFIGNLSENRVVKTSLQSGGTVLTNTNKSDTKTPKENIDFDKSIFTFDTTRNIDDDVSIIKSYPEESSPLYKNIIDFSQNALKMLTPNIRQPAVPTNFNHRTPPGDVKTNLYNPLNLLVNGQVVRHVPGMPGPVVENSPPIRQNLPPPMTDRSPKPTETYPQDKNGARLFAQPDKLIKSPKNNNNNNNNNNPVQIRTTTANFLLPERLSRSPKSDGSDTKCAEDKSAEGEIKKFARPNSLALKPTTASLKQHHGLTPTMFNQILISPDTPRVAKKYAEHFLHGNYFSYLGLKSSTRPVYCTLNKTQPFYVPHFKKLSMYSEWRQQDTKQDKLYVSDYDSRQINKSYSIAGKTSANLIIHSSYKFVITETSSAQSEKEDEPQKNNTILGGYECNEDYIYVRGRGRGRYVCDQCGIRCKKPSMLKKHIRTHSNDRPYTCSHCNFSFKTKGNLTKHMKSKAHSKNSTTSTGSSSSSAQQSAQSSESDTDDSGMDSSDESTRQQEHEAAYGLLSLSQKPTQTSGNIGTKSPTEAFMTTEELAHVSKTIYAKNKFLDQPNTTMSPSFKTMELNISASEETAENQNVRTYLGMGSISRPLTYPYTTVLIGEKVVLSSPEPENKLSESVTNPVEPKCIKQFNVIKKYVPQGKLSPDLPENENYCYEETLNNVKNITTTPNRTLPTLKINDVVITAESVSDIRKRKFSITEFPHKNKIQKNDEVMDLSMANNQEKLNGTLVNEVVNNFRLTESEKNVANEIFNALQKPQSPPRLEINEDREEIPIYNNNNNNNNGTVIILRPLSADTQDQHQNYNEEPGNNTDYDNSAMETLADVATKQVKLEKNTLAKSVASEFLKLATKNENIDGGINTVNFGPVNKDVNDIIVKSEGNKSCTICSKSFNKPSQLRLHMNIHYLERPFRCDSCSVSFRTKGHLQKHERSASHHNKLSSSPALSSSEPRPFKCSDCNIAFRIHGHLAKHLRSKMHIQRLECLKKLPFGLYAELERSNSLLTEINTCDGDQCLESLKTLAKKVFVNHPNKLNEIEQRETIMADS
ncbi:uncharacterized protein LOC130894605 [Diorhabda carinulata]|uniref:uncharacterized protein LOC130894605 n=1 Tax=Diorhabda carinulata TaxID=1163345 RepID=UPI0025A27DE8|nr:uncharacterized protein LOC130894605 [Diorhabda carinulata]XP_057657502.1 uncharacterized protein LOC130894605 [Diorhabda carinulata]XP_057657503.1 uncharacterized protein LOC130894605 [Diorhabda carinulata]XP_057657504.1 uncharacterized protein LOC130894605 [Diorhabda carinulata]